MNRELINNLERYCQFEELAENMSDEAKMKTYLHEQFTNIFDFLFVKGSITAGLLGKENLDYGAAHIWSYKFNKRIGQYLFPKEMSQDLIIEAIREFFFSRKERAKYFDITNILSTQKQTIIFKRGSFEEFQNDNDFNNPEFILPEEILFPDKLRPNDYNSIEEMIKSLQKAEENIVSNSNSMEISQFFDYVVKKCKTLLGVDITIYKLKVEILKLFPPILLCKRWKYIYRFIANLIPDKPSGGFFIRVKNHLDKKQIQNLQFICNFIYMKLALKELNILQEEFKSLFISFNTAFNAFREHAVEN